ncbi:MAG: hypothetical protein JW778_00810 [Candidatus Altiarchaeota archaeon]|nr:hypothetical protein [Candidatus Altiarchaeota archaeon]
MAKTKKKKTTKTAIKDAKKFLSDVPADKCFWVNNGWIMRNLQELPLALENMGEETFVYHVNKAKNDFHNWITHVIGDKTLAQGIKSSNKKDMLAKVKKRIAQLKG